MEKKRMLYNGLKLSDEDRDRLFDLTGTNPIGVDLCYGCMMYEPNDKDAYFIPEDAYFIPATETIEGIRAKIKEFEETGEDPFIREYELAPDYNHNVLY